MSREHVISQSLFLSEYVDVSGYRWCKGGPKRIGLSSFTKKALCRKHNNDLSPIDSSGAYAFDILRQQTTLTIERGKQPDRNYRKLTFSISATLLERWLLKTLINISYGGEHLIGPDSGKPGYPSAQLVNIVFGRKRFPPGNGLHIVSKSGLDIHFSDRVEMAPLVKDAKYIHGGFFKFFGVLMFLDLVPGGLTIPFDQITTDTDWHFATASRPFRQFRATVGRRISHVVNFNWR